MNAPRNCRARSRSRAGTGMSDAAAARVLATWHDRKLPAARAESGAPLAASASVLIVDYTRGHWTTGLFLSWNCPVQTIISIQKLCKVYASGFQALKSVDLTIRRGEIFALLGPNGAGKTTMLRLLTGALAPSAGTVRLWGAQSHERDFLAAKRRVGIVPQLPGMYRDMTAREWLLFVRSLYDRGKPEEVAAMLGLTEFLGRRMADLSGGVQRRLSLAAALLPEPELLLLDEPTVGLDPVAAREVRGWLHQAMQGRTVLMCTHNLAEAEELCQEVIILRGGRVLLDAPIAKLRERTAPKLALACLQGAAALSTALRALGHPDSQIVDAEVLISIPADASAERAAPDLLRALLAAGIDVHGCRLVRPSLEDLFLDVLKTGDTAEDSHVDLPA